MYEANPTVTEKAWERFLEAEQVALEERRRGGLDRALGGKPLPGESPEELWWLAVEDRHLAEEGLVRGAQERHRGPVQAHRRPHQGGPPGQDRGRKREGGLAHGTAQKGGRRRRIVETGA